ncbi:hypothetical protein [Bosea sp. BIWAKO-01]|uniref:hypothetical protein n=1 Tax=Bosea sp. BIWAKO-01 TaxID=506668 RepID=UPI000852F68F|nr:hypothetical protein [Bosea sp. BIWAKO-01]GAU83478.1 hypothetical protein BIWAKO_03404 [Bosea sp. BIWAKO-01]
MKIDPRTLQMLLESLQDDLYELCHELMLALAPERDGQGIPVETEHAIQGVLARFGVLLKTS